MRRGQLDGRVLAYFDQVAIGVAHIAAGGLGLMSTSDARSSNNHRGSHAWLQSWAHLMVDRRSPGYCRVTFDHPPINTITATTVVELAELVDLIEDDSDLNVVVF